MKLSNKLFAVAIASLITTGVALADDIGQDRIYGSVATESSLSQLPATAAGSASHVSSMKVSDGVNAIPDYLEGVSANQKTPKTLLKRPAMET